MRESGTATTCAAASSREVLGYESHGREAKRRETSGDGRENVLVVYIPANGKGDRELWRRIKRPATRKENRTAWRRLPIVYARSESSGILAAFVPHRDDFIANPGFLPFSIFTGNSLLKISLRAYSIRLQSNIYSYQNIRFLLFLLFPATQRHIHLLLINIM